MQQDNKILKNEKNSAPPTRNILLTIAYDGSNYHGWQIQKNALTVQEVFQKSLLKVINENVDIKGCSRTDTGVHANMYAINFKTSCKINCENLIYALNHFLPNDVSVTSATEVNPEFHARYSCKAKEYIYKIWNHKIRNPFFNHRALHYWYPLDVRQLNDAAQMFVGAHDFTAFATLDKRETKNMIRNIESISVYNSKTEKDIIEIKVKADGFLYNMVRIITGTLLRVAQEKIKKEDIPLIIKSKNRSKAGPTAPSEGLYLNKVFY